MTDKRTRARKATEASKSRKASEAPKARKAPKSIAASASTSSRVSSKDTAKAAIEAAAAAVASRAARATEPATAVSPAAVATPTAAPAETAARFGALLQTPEAYATVKATAETLRQAVAESAAASSRGVIEVNDKFIDAMRAQSDAAFDLWRSALSATTVSEAIRIQTGGARQVYETAATQWKDLAETTTRWLTASVKPMQSVFAVSRR